MSLLTVALGLLSLASPALGDATTTTFYIDALYNFDSMSSCAQTAVSHIINDGEWGCGTPYTSYDCFCTSSFARFSSMIPAHVTSACPNSITSAQGSQASALFSQYCALGREAAASSPLEGYKVSTTAEAAAVSLTPGAVPGQPTASSTGSPAPPSNDHHRTVAIAVGVVVPVFFLLSLIVALTLFLRHRRNSRAKEVGPDGELPHSPVFEADSSTPQDRSDTEAKAKEEVVGPVEIQGTQYVAELETPISHLQGFTKKGWF